MDNAILWYQVKNYGSFGNEGAFVDLTTSEKDRHKDLWRLVGGQRVNLITAIMGANGSGKTTLLKPLAFLSNFFWSIPAKITDQLEVNSSKAVKEIPSIKTSFVMNGMIYTYELIACELFVAYEALYVRNENNKNIYIFKREVNKKRIPEYLEKTSQIVTMRELNELLKEIEYTYSEKNDIFPFGKSEAIRTPVNTSIISAARRVGVRLAEDITFFFMPITNVDANGRMIYDASDINDLAAYLHGHEKMFDNLKNIIKKWDFGLNDIEIEKESRTNANGETKYNYIVNGVHLLENGTAFKLPFLKESAGTQSAFVRIFQILCALEGGNPCVIDELGDDLHPHMVKPILNLFINPELNPNGAQLIFTCHKPDLINYLGKYRVIIAQKKDNVSECYRLDDFPSSEARADDNLAAKYLAGSFGGVPEL
ncbi:AAA family ATPase [Klebsiella aerogenes]|uniref:AAA family ATPase n=1 Tax=Klebsiella aerogenes TaxID=548 RepID=UPI00163BD830|nr:ATP-binding protein [Klebsiella aerogenes]EIV2479733.1 AAA family ATPase [Klebsiella aerogenes]MDX6890453.1 AAA family ATPase [Klebsiella aerogenes]